MARKRLWTVDAHVTDGCARSIMDDLGYGYNGTFFDQHGKGVSAQEWSPAKPEWMLRLREAVQARGEYCEIS